MAGLLRSVDGVSPVGLSIDIAALYAFPDVNPLWVSFDYWIHTASTVPGGLSADMSWLDAVSNTVVKSGSTIDSQDPTVKNSIMEVFSIQRFSPSAAWTLDFTAANPANDGLISYRILIQNDQSVELF